LPWVEFENLAIMKKTILKEKLERSFKLYDDLIEFLSEDTLAKRLPGLPSNELGQQLWCVVGARNSYLKALKAGEWKGFDCPMTWEETRSI